MACCRARYTELVCAGVVPALCSCGGIPMDCPACPSSDVPTVVPTHLPSRTATADRDIAESRSKKSLLGLLGLLVLIPIAISCIVACIIILASRRKYEDSEYDPYRDDPLDEYGDPHVAGIIAPPFAFMGHAGDFSELPPSVELGSARSRDLDPHRAHHVTRLPFGVAIRQRSRDELDAMYEDASDDTWDDMLQSVGPPPPPLPHPLRHARVIPPPAPPTAPIGRGYSRMPFGASVPQGADPLDVWLV